MNPTFLLTGELRAAEDEERHWGKVLPEKRQALRLEFIPLGKEQRKVNLDAP
jgi:hypothetical protein